MDLYFSGTPRVDKFQMVENSLCKYRLFSLHGSYERSVLNWFDHPQNGIAANLDKPRPTKLMADSGAFTSWKSGHHTTVDEVISSYTKFFERADKFKIETWAINLDVIPGSFGADPTPEQIKEAIKTSDINFKILTDKFGPRILPVYHQGEPLERVFELESMTDNTSKYICVSPRNDLPEAKRVIWSQQVHAKLKPATKTHGLATTGNKMLERVSWYSVDSATWILLGAYGGICFYWDTGSKQTYSSLAISEEGGRDRFQGAHFNTLEAPYQKAITERIESMGFTVEQIKKDVRPRSLFNIKNLAMYAEKVSLNKKVHSYQETLFGV